MNTPNTKLALITPEAMLTSTEAPGAPVKEKVARKYQLDNIPKLVLPESSLGWGPTDDEEEDDMEEVKRGAERMRRRDAEAWEEERRTGVREKFSQYDPEYVLQLDSIAAVHQIKKWYEPASQPRTAEEWTYVAEVREAAVERLKQLNCFCDECCWQHWDDMPSDELLDYLQ